MRSGLQKLLTGIHRTREQRVEPLFDRARAGRARLVGVGGRDKQRAGGDNRERGDADALPLLLRPRLPRRCVPVAVVPRPGGRHSANGLDAPVRRVLPGWQRDDEQAARGEARELLVRQVRDGDRKLPVGPDGHACDGRAVVRGCELRHPHRGQRRVLVERGFVLVVRTQAVVGLSGGRCCDLILAL